MGRLIDRLFHRRVLRRWDKMATHAGSADLMRLRRIRTRARQLRRRVDRVLHVTDSRLTLPLVGSNAIQKPLHSDWAYRPELWRGPLNPPGMAAIQSKAKIGDEVTLFHDCQISELTVRQIRNTREEDLAPFGLRLDVFQFDGSFLSLAIELPNSAVDGLLRRHLVRLAVVVETEQPLEIFARLNIQHGPNTEQLVRELPLGNEEAAVEFDLAYSNLNEKRVERAWIDLIFEGPQMNQIVLRDITLSRRPRAEV
ncbi:MAG: hypothetical protein KUG69_12420 [Marinosulfonomonas sp.]|nr:hypothetical protein [Marinosulfonomonas sp.]